MKSSCLTLSLKYFPSLPLGNAMIYMYTQLYTVEPREYGDQWAKKLWPRVFLQENVWRFLPGGQKKVAVLSRWP